VTNKNSKTWPAVANPKLIAIAHCGEPKAHSHGLQWQKQMLAIVTCIG